MYFNHKHGCQKCYTVGEYDPNVRRTCFANFNSDKRTNSGFRDRYQPVHHRGKSILEDITDSEGNPLIDMVKQFPTSDPLHLLEVGIMKRLFHMWIKGTTTFKNKWSKDLQALLSTYIYFCNKELPNDINRKVRGLNYIKFWKATEFRTFLLYFGIVAFKAALNEEEYTHFLYLSLATRLCSCKYYVKQKSLKTIARKLFSSYCNNFVKIYGRNEVVSNVHNISHICDDVDEFGTLTDISTYPFENFLHDIKLHIQPSNTPIQQISRRLAERSLDKENEQFNFELKRLERASWVPTVKYVYKQSNEYFYKFIQITPNVSLSVRKIGDKWFLTKNGDIVEMKYVSVIRNSFIIHGMPIANKTDFFTRPYSSHKSDIYVSKGEKGQEKIYECHEIKAKMVCFSYDNSYVFIPLLHSFDECTEFYP